MNKPIFIFSQTLQPGGAEKQAIILAKALCEAYDIFFIVFYKDRIDNNLYLKLKSNNIKILILQGNFFIKFNNLIKLFKAQRNPILFNYLLLPSVFGGLTAKIAGVKSFGGIRNSKLDRKKVWLNKMAHNYINYKTIYNSYKGLEYCKNLGFKTSKSIVIPNAIKITESVLVRENSKLPIIISVGRFEKAKDYNTAIKAILELKRKNLNFEYWIVGWGSLEEEIRKFIKQNNLELTTKIFVNPPNLPELYKKADIYLQTSLYEGLSNTVMEAMSYTLPCVVTNVGDNNRLILDEKTGFLSIPHNYSEISEKLEKLLINYPLRLEMGKNAYNHITENYSTERFKKSYIELINSIYEA